MAAGHASENDLLKKCKTVQPVLECCQLSCLGPKHLPQSLKDSFPTVDSAFSCGAWNDEMETIPLKKNCFSPIWAFINIALPTCPLPNDHNLAMYQAECFMFLSFL